jgi:hypothetical protein
MRIYTLFAGKRDSVANKVTDTTTETVSMLKLFIAAN